VVGREQAPGRLLPLRIAEGPRSKPAVETAARRPFASSGGTCPDSYALFPSRSFLAPMAPWRVLGVLLLGECFGSCCIRRRRLVSSRWLLPCRELLTVFPTAQGVLCR